MVRLPRRSPLGPHSQHRHQRPPSQHTHTLPGKSHAAQHHTERMSWETEGLLTWSPFLFPRSDPDRKPLWACNVCPQGSYATGWSSGRKVIWGIRGGLWPPGHGGLRFCLSYPHTNHRRGLKMLTSVKMLLRSNQSSFRDILRADLTLVENCERSHFFPESIYLQVSIPCKWWLLLKTTVFILYTVVLNRFIQ